jgi:hypothetical protein
MVPEIVRLERPGLCSCGEIVAAGERARDAAPQERVVCLDCLAPVSADPEPEDPSRNGNALLPAKWTADAAVIAATLKALREDAGPIWPASDTTVLDVPTDWSTQPSECARVDGPHTVPEPPITLPRRRVPPEPQADADLSRATDPPEPTAVVPPEPTAVVPPEPNAVVPPEPTAPPLTVSSTVPPVETRRSRHEAAAVHDVRMPSRAPRRRAGVFTRLLTVRTFRAQQAQPKLSKSTAAMRDLLDATTNRGVLSLHNRRVPGRRGRIDHIAIGPAGIYVIDVLHFKNASIEVRPASDGDAGTDDLVVGGRVMTDAVRAVAQRVEVLRLILLAAGLNDVPVAGALCFVDGLLPLSAAKLQIGGIHVLRPSGLPALVAGSGAYGTGDRQTLHEFLADRLPAST